MRKRQLAEILLQSDLADAQLIRDAAAEAARQGRRLAWTVVESRVIDERELARLIARETGLPIAEPLPHNVPAVVYRRIPAPIAREYKAVPIAAADGKLIVAMVDPTDVAALDVLAAATRLPVTPVVALKSSVDTLLDRLYPIDVDVDATVISDRNLADDSGDFAGESAEAGLDTMTIAAPVLAGNPTEERDVSARLEEIEARVAKLSTMLQDVQQLLAELRKEFPRK